MNHTASCRSWSQGLSKATATSPLARLPSPRGLPCAPQTSNSTNWNPEDEAYIRRSKCSPTCFLNGSCNEELGRCDCIKGKKGRDCSEVGLAFYLMQGFGRTDSLGGEEQPCMNHTSLQSSCMRHTLLPCCPQTYSDADMETMCREQFYPRVIECLRYEQPCLNACNKQGKCHYGVCKCKPGGTHDMLFLYTFTVCLACCIHVRHDLL